MSKSSVWIMGGMSLLATLFVVPAFAQGQGQGQGQGRGRGFGGFGMGGGMGPLQLVMAEPVQKELAINEEQAGKLKSLGEELRGEMESLVGGGLNFQELAQLSGEERTKRMNELRAQMTENTKKINEKFLPKVHEVLDAPQRERLQQIAWQANGASALQDQKLASELKLNKDQTDKVASISKEYQEKQQELFSGGGGGADIQERFAKMREMSEARDKQLMEVLTAEQREELEKLKGKPFDVAQLRGRIGGGGPGRKGGDRPQRPGADKDK